MKPADQLRTDEPLPGLQRLEAWFAGHAFDPHRHETYAIGVTLSGTQAFRYRGMERASVTGQTIVLHPDESHDGHSGGIDGFSYRMIYVDPALIRRAMADSQPLPFVADVVATDDRLAELVDDAFEGFPDSLDQLAADAVIAGLAEQLSKRGKQSSLRVEWSKTAAEVEIARELLDGEFNQPITSADLEQATGVDRFTLARAFRVRLGTSPHRYLVGRRLAAARRMIAAGGGIADAAASAGFADQSHMTRHFKARFGITPGRFEALAMYRR